MLLDGRIWRNSSNPRVATSLRSACAAAVLACFFACGHSWPALAPLPKADDYEGSDAVVLFDERTVDYHLESGHPVADVRERRAVLALKATPKLPTKLAAGYVQGFSEPLEVRFRILLADGKVLDDEGAALDGPLLADRTLYTDERQRFRKVPPTPDGAVLETETAVRWKDVRLFSQVARFGSGWPTKVERLRVGAPSDWVVEWQASQLGAPMSWQPRVSHSEGRTLYEWDARDVEPLVSDSWAPAWDDQAPTVRIRLASWRENGHDVRGFHDARDLSRWAYDLWKTRPIVTDPMKRVVREAQEAEKGDPSGVARRLYDFAANQVAYCAVELGMGGWKPHSPVDVFALRYGDCKDKANLLGALLSEAGIASVPVLIAPREGLPSTWGLPTAAGTLNHVILRVSLPSGDVLADPTSETVPFGEIPWQDAEAPILPVTAEGNDWERAPAVRWEDNEQLEELAYTLTDAGRANGRFTVTSRGPLAAGLRSRLHQAASVRATWTLRDWLGVPQSEIEGDVALPSGKGPLRLEGRLFGHPVRSAGNSWLVRPSDALGTSLPSLPQVEPLLPYVLEARARLRSTLALTLPASATVASLPPPVELDSQFAHYALRWTEEGHTVTLNRELTWRERVIPPSQHAQLAEFCSAGLAAESTPLVVHLP